MSKKCVLFCRVSTSSQDWERQRACLYANAIRDGYKESDMITIGHKESGYKLDEDERKGLQELDTYLQSGDVDCVYVWEISRLARKPKILYEVRDKFKEYGVQLKCDKPSFVLLTEDLKEFDTSSTIVFSIFAALAEQEIFIKKARFADGKQKNAQKGRYNGGNIPFGYRLREDKTFEVNEDEATIIHKIFDLYEDGYSTTQIVRKLKEDNVEGRFRCTLSFVHNLLTSELLTGEPHEDREVKSIIKGEERKWHLYSRQYPKIIEKEQFQRCRDIAETNNTNADKTQTIYFANRIFRCPTCGRYMVGVKNRCIYRCYDANNPNRELNGYNEESRCQDKRNYSINIVDTILWHCAVHWETHKNLADIEKQRATYSIEINNAEDKIRIANQHIDRLGEKKERIMDDYYDGRLSKEKYFSRIEILQQDINNIRAEILSHTHLIEQYQNLINSLETDDTIRLIVEKEKNGLRSLNFNEQYLYRAAFNKCMKSIDDIIDDEKRYKIIHQNVKSIDVTEGEILHQFLSRASRIKARYYTVFNYTDERFDFCVISNSGKGAQIYFIDEHHTSPLTHPVFPVIQRFEDKDKKKRRVQQRALQEENQAQRRTGKYTIKELMEQSGWSYGEIRYAIIHKGLKAEKDGKEFLVAADDWNNYCSQIRIRKE